MKKFNLFLKEPHLEAITDIKERFSISSNKECTNAFLKFQTKV